MRSRSILSTLAAISALVVAFVVALSTEVPTHAQKDGFDQSAAQHSGAGLSTGLISLVPGQSARIAVVNVGGKEFQGEFLFVPLTEQGKATVPIRCNAFAAPGDAASAMFSHTGGANRIDLYAQVHIEENANDLENLVPSLQIIDDQTGRTVQLLSGSDLVSFRPIFNPTLPPPEN